MKLEIMETATKTAKPIWDTVLIAMGSVAVFLQSVIGTETLVWAQIFAAVSVGIFALTRAYWWFKNDGYKDNRP